MATMKDVAREAGVALGSVSRVINHAPGVKQKTIDKVNAAIKKLNYVPDEYARGLKVKSSKTVALILPSIWNLFFAEFAYYVEKYLAEKNYKLLLCNYSNNPKEEQHYIKMAKQNKIDAIICITYDDLDKYFYAGIPLVSIDRYFEQKISYVTSENYEGGRLAAEELLKHGVKHPAFIGTYNHNPSDVMKRHKGFAEYLSEQGYEFADVYLLEPVTKEEEETELFKLLDKNPEVDGIFCNTDSLLLDVKNWLAQREISVPEQIQLIGYDGIKPDFNSELGISTIRQPLPEMAKCAVEMVIEKVEQHRDEQRIERFPVSYIEGNTTKNI